MVRPLHTISPGVSRRFLHWLNRGGGGAAERNRCRQRGVLQDGGDKQRSTNKAETCLWPFRRGGSLPHAHVERAAKEASLSRGSPVDTETGSVKQSLNLLWDPDLENPLTDLKSEALPGLTEISPSSERTPVITKLGSTQFQLIL